MPDVLRVPMTRTEFDALGTADPEWAIYSMYAELIDGNLDLMEAGKAAGSTTDPSVFSRLVPGQRALFALTVFDGQVRNGGLTQFFWNYPELAGEVADGLLLIGDDGLGQSYGRAFGQIVTRLGPWQELRESAYADPAKPDWEPFRRSYELLDLGGFDDNYYDTHQWPDGGGPSVVTQIGLGNRMLKRLEAWVRANPDEFIRTPDGAAS